MFKPIKQTRLFCPQEIWSDRFVDGLLAQRAHDWWAFATILLDLDPKGTILLKCIRDLLPAQDRLACNNDYQSRFATYGHLILNAFVCRIHGENVRKDPIAGLAMWPLGAKATAANEDLRKLAVEYCRTATWERADWQAQAHSALGERSRVIHRVAYRAVSKREPRNPLTVRAFQLGVLQRSPSDPRLLPLGMMTWPPCECGSGKRGLFQRAAW